MLLYKKVELTQKPMFLPLNLKELWKNRFLNKVYNDQYLITGVTIERYSVPIFIGDELVTDPYSELVKQGIENTPGGLFATVVGNYGLVSDSENDYFVKVTVQFKEI